MIEAALAESEGRVSGPRGAAAKSGASKTRPLTQKSSDWESTNIGSKFISRTDSMPTRQSPRVSSLNNNSSKPRIGRRF